MDPIHHDKIVDKLLQYRGKIPKDSPQYGTRARKLTRKARVRIDNLIEVIDELAKLYEAGLIR